MTRRRFLTVIGAMAAIQWAVHAQPSCAEPRWVDHRTHGPFQFHATFPLASLTPFFNELSSLELELQRTLAVPPAGRSIDVYLFDDEQTYRTTLEQLYPRVPYRRALYVQRSGHGTVYAFWQPDLAVDLRHECTHALLHANLAMVPLWLDEGLAEYFEMPEPQRAFDNPHLSKLRWNLRFGMIRSVESLQSCSELDNMGGEEYRFAWAWVHFMLHGPLPAHRALVHYLRDIERGDPPGKLSDRLRAAVPDLEGQFTEHFKHWKR
jgi:hypothetical protein